MNGPQEDEDEYNVEERRLTKEYTYLERETTKMRIK